MLCGVSYFETWVYRRVVFSETGCILLTSNSLCTGVAEWAAFWICVSASMSWYPCLRSPCSRCRFSRNQFAGGVTFVVLSRPSSFICSFNRFVMLICGLVVAGIRSDSPTVFNAECSTLSACRDAGYLSAFFETAHQHRKQPCIT